MLGALAPAGRMSLTIYLTQSLVASLVFNGYGLGLGDDVGIGVAVAMAVGLSMRVPYMRGQAPVATGLRQSAFDERRDD